MEDLDLKIVSVDFDGYIDEWLIDIPTFPQYYYQHEIRDLYDKGYNKFEAYIRQQIHNYDDGFPVDKIYLVWDDLVKLYNYFN